MAARWESVYALGAPLAPPRCVILALRGVAELGVVLLLFLIGLEIRLDELRRLGRDILAFGLPQIGLSALVIGLYALVEICRLGGKPGARPRLRPVLDSGRGSAA